MKAFSCSLYAAIALSSAFFVAPSVAAPFSMLKGPSLSLDIVNVESRSERFYGQRSRRGHRSNRYERRGDDAYYNNHRGYRKRRDGYRQRDGWWFPPAAFITGAIIGGSLNNPGYGTPHVSWCYDHYNSYRDSDNSYQPYGGGSRQSCYSPHG